MGGPGQKPGSPIPSERGLADALTALALDGRAVQDSSITPGEALEAAWAKDSEACFRLLRELLTPQEPVPSAAARFLLGPWRRIFDLSVSGTARTVILQDSNRAKYTLINGLVDLPNAGHSGLEIIQVNGRLEDTEPADTTLRLEGSSLRRTSTNATIWWSQSLNLAVQTSPVFFFAADVSSVSQAIRLRSAAELADLSPAYLICPELAPERQLALDRQGIRWIPVSGAQFAASFLGPQHTWVGTGRRRSEAARLSEARSEPIKSPSDLIATAPDGRARSISWVLNRLGVIFAMASQRPSVRGHEKVPTCGQEEVPTFLT